LDENQDKMKCDTKDAQEPGEGEGDRNEMEELRLKAEENWQLFLKARAEMENYRRRSERDLGRMILRGKRDLLLKILGVVDNLERAVGQGETGGMSFLEGVKMIHRQVQELLIAEGVCAFECEGKGFDPAVHECIAVLDSSEVDRETVCEELERGYTFHDEVLRPAKVKVARPAK
jgi:molecular chaperone GrpE